MPGLYTVVVYVADKDGGSGAGTTTEYVVIYDPDGGFVTGAGWIDSPAGAYAADPSLSGKAIFAFVSKYTKGRNLPAPTVSHRRPGADGNEVGVQPENGVRERRTGPVTDR